MTEEFPEPEKGCTPIEVSDLRPRSGPRILCGTVKKAGWDLVRLTTSRGPYIGADGSVLSTSDSIVLCARGPARLDGMTPIAVASWRDYKLDFAYRGEIRGRKINLTGVNSDGLKDWIKGIACEESE